MAGQEQNPRSTSKVESPDIASVLRSPGPVVKCVLLRTAQKKSPPNQNVRDNTELSAAGAAKLSDRNKNPTSSDNEQSEHKTVQSLDTNDISTGPGTSISDTRQQYPLVDLVEDIEIDTTPAKNKVAELLGGPFTFLGQYEEEGIVLMARRAWVEDDLLEEGQHRHHPVNFDGMSIKNLRTLASKWDVCLDNIVEKQELVNTMKKKELELPLVNPHPLQPPLQNLRVRGDILCMKIAVVDDELDENKEGVNNSKRANDVAEGEDSLNVDGNSSEEETNVPLQVPSNEEFFLDYTKNEYLAFATRTNVAHPPQQASDSSQEEEEDGTMQEPTGEENGDKSGAGGGDEDDDDDDDYQLMEDMEEMTEEEEKSAMLNIVMSELLRKFREENGRGPDTRELLEIRASVAEQLGVEVATFDDAHAGAEEDSSQQAEGTNARKRKAESDATGMDESDNIDVPNAKRVSFHSNLVSEHHYEGDNSGDDNSNINPEEQEEAAGSQQIDMASKEKPQQNDCNEDEDGKPPASEKKQQVNGNTDDQDGKPPAE